MNIIYLNNVLVHTTDEFDDESIGTLAEQMDEMEKKVLHNALRVCEGNKSQTAKELKYFTKNIIL